jgi:hypothetical protein
MPEKKSAAAREVSPAVMAIDAWVVGLQGAPSRAPRVGGSETARAAGVRRARRSPAWARRRRDAAVCKGFSRAGYGGEEVEMGVHGGARMLLGQTQPGFQVGLATGVAVVLRRRTARRHGRRRARRLRLGRCVLDPGYGTTLGAPRHGEHRGSVTWSARHGGGAATARRAQGSVAAAGLEGKGQGPVLAARSRRARAGVHACVLRGVHRRAREGMLATRTRRGARHGAAATDRAEA